MDTYLIPDSLLPLAPPPRNPQKAVKPLLIASEHIYEPLVYDHLQLPYQRRRRNKPRTLRNIVLSGLFLTTGFSIFLLIMHNFGLLNQKLPQSTVTEPTTPPKSPVTSTKSPTEPTTEPSTEPSTHPPTEPPTDRSTEARTEPSTEPSTEPLTEPSTEPSTEPPTDLPTEPPTELLTDAPTEPPSTGNCAIGYTKFVNTGFCYKFFNHRANFDGAQEVCMSEDGELASIHSEEENNFLAALVEDDKKVHTNRGVLEEDNEIWIELHYDEGNWRWVDGTPVDYTKWADGGPSRMTAQPEVTMVVSRITGYSPEGKHWHNAKKSSTQKGLICKKAPI